MKYSFSVADYLAGKCNIRDIITPTKVTNLHIVSGGARGAVLTEKLSAVRSGYLIKAARNLYDCVILDTPPCGMLSDASEVAELADCGVLVVRQNYASRDQISEGVVHLADSGLDILGCVFNQSVRTLSSGYGYGYGYGYGKDKK